MGPEVIEYELGCSCIRPSLGWFLRPLGKQEWGRGFWAEELGFLWSFLPVR